MIAISRLFENHFDDPKISAEELRLFVEDHLGRLESRKTEAAHGALFSTLAAATIPLFAAFDAALSARNTLLAALGGDTISKNDVLQVFHGLIRQREGRIRDKFGKDTPGYKSFFPRGLSEYTKAPLGTVKTLMDRLVSLSKSHSAILGPELAEEFAAMRARFEEARSEQVEQKGSVAGARRDLARTRALLERQVGLNMLDLAKIFLGQPERAGDFFNQSLLEDVTRQREETPFPAKPVPSA